MDNVHKSTALAAGFLAAFCLVSTAAEPAGIKPLGADGKPLNLDFEDGTLKDWVATGTAFDRQPIKGDVVSKRRNDMRSGHQGQYWVGSFEIDGDTPQGTLTSVPFKLTQPWASFLVGGGSTTSTKVEIFVKEGQSERAVFRASGADSEELRRVGANLTPYLSKEIFIRLTDKSSTGWGHINFDDFLLHDSEPKLASVPAPKKDEVPPPPLDDVKFAGLPPERAAQEMTLPAGFKATLFAGEPDIVQPIAFCIDDRGRLWVVEGMTYPVRETEGQGKDRILVFEDTDGDGKFDRRSVFMEHLNLVSGIQVGFGGVWIGAAPYLMYVPLKDGDEPKPAGEPKILLDGFDFKRDTHETLNTFTWGPDGWLYGCHGVFCPSLVGKPGTPEHERQWLDAAVWRYHPTKHLFEIFAEGTSNPWGVDFDARGQCIIEACVIPHLLHMIQGARYERQGGEHYCINLEETERNERHRDSKSRKPLYPYFYDNIKTIGDHVHYAGVKGPHAGNGRSDAAGGGHAHAGLMVYLGDSWPEKYRGQLFMNNIHGQRINMDTPERQGSGFVGHHGADFINFNDRWSQILNLLYDQNGSVFMIDWYDKNQCHHNDPKGHDRSNGRIFKITYNDQKWTSVDLQKKTDEELVQLQLHKNEWYARHARRILQERGPNPTVQQSLVAYLNPDNLPVRMLLPAGAQSVAEESSKLRLLWALHGVVGLNEPLAFKLLKNYSEYVRAWTIQLMTEDKKVSPELLQEFARLAREDKSPVVRLYLASALQRLPLEQRSEILSGLIAHVEDATDHNLPLMYWYAAEPVASQSPARAVALLGKSKIPKLREYITRRMAATSSEKKTADAKAP